METGKCPGETSSDCAKVVGAVKSVNRMAEKVLQGARRREGMYVSLTWTADYGILEIEETDND